MSLLVVVPCGVVSERAPQALTAPPSYWCVSARARARRAPTCHESGVYGASHDGAVAFGHEHGILVAYAVPAHDYGVRPSRPASIFRPISVRRPVGRLLLLLGRGAVPSTGSKYNPWRLHHQPHFNTGSAAPIARLDAE